MLRTILVAVPAFRRVEPAITSGPTAGAMVLIGKTYGNLMVDVQTGSEKLKDRARRIVNIVTGLDYEDADRLLVKARWNVKAAIVMPHSDLPVIGSTGIRRRNFNFRPDASPAADTPSTSNSSFAG